MQDDFLVAVGILIKKKHNWIRTYIRIEPTFTVSANVTS